MLLRLIDNRKTMKKILLPIMAFLTGTVMYAQRTVLENESLRAEFDDRNGALVSLVNKTTGWNFIPRPELGQSFLMLVPLDGPDFPIEKEIRYNNAIGVNQPVAPKVQRGDNTVSFTWNSIESEHISNLDISFTATATLTDKGLLFSGEVENRSNYVVEYIGWPFFGEIAVPDKPEKFYCETREFTREFYPSFPNEKGYWGVDWHTNIIILPSDGFMLLHNSNQGMLISEAAPTDDELLIGMFELIPGFELPGKWPESDEMDGEKTRMQASLNHVLYTNKGEKSRLTPTRVSIYSGDWYKGLAPYREMMKKPNSNNNWASDLKAWRRVTISSPEDIIRYARQCVDNGISTLVVNNWKRSVPYSLMQIYPDVKRAVNEAHKLGCKVILEGDFFKADPNGPKYGELRNYLQKDPYGFSYDHSLMCTMHNTLNELIRTDWPIVYNKLGIDGYLCTEQNARTSTPYCFAKGHGHKAPKFIGSGIADLNRQFATDARAANSAFLVGGNYHIDAESDIFDFMYLNNAPRQGTIRYINPYSNIVAAINVRYAREDINTCVQNRYTVCYNDLAGTSDINDMPSVVEYASKVEKLRTEYRDYIWDADMLSPEEEVTGDGLEWSVYKNRKNGKKAIVIVNHDSRNTRNAKVSFTDGSGMFSVSPENMEPSSASGNVSVPSLSLVVVIEK